MIAKGTFEVKVTEEPPLDEVDGVTIARATVDKVFAGPLSGTSKVHMIGVRTKTKGSAAYVAVERIDGTLDGRRGTFVAAHHGSMTGGQQHLVLTIAPDSGTGELRGISGKMGISIVGGQHFYEVEYEFGERA
jgi:hypothetical protein